MLSHFSRVRLCATPQTAAHQAPSSLGFSRQEHWSGLPFPSPMHESEVPQSCPTLSDLVDCSLPDSSVHRIFQARVLRIAVISPVTQSCLTFRDPMNCSTPGLPVHHQLPEFTQTHVHQVGDAIQLSHPLSSPSPAFTFSQHQGLFQ